MLAEAGVASRRAAEALIAAGRVHVNGQPVPLGTCVDPASDQIEFDGRPIGGPQNTVYWALFKPRGVISTARDPFGRRTVVDWVKDVPARLYPVGRLDAESEGLILLTNDGRLSHALLHPRQGVEKEYRAVLREAVSDAALARLAAGVDLSDGKTAPASVFLEQRSAAATRIRIILHEGRNRQIRRMGEAIGHPVISLCRIRIGPLRLGRLKPGQARPLEGHEIAALFRAADLPRP